MLLYLLPCPSDRFQRREASVDVTLFDNHFKRFMYNTRFNEVKHFNNQIVVAVACLWVRFKNVLYDCLTFFYFHFVLPVFAKGRSSIIPSGTFINPSASVCGLGCSSSVDFLLSQNSWSSAITSVVYTLLPSLFV